MMKKTQPLALLAMAVVILVLGVAAQQKADDKAVDPVCGMTVTKAKAAATFDHKGTTYYFCSKGCKDAFAKEPEKYLAKKAEPKEVQGYALGPGGAMHAMPKTAGQQMGPACCGMPAHGMPPMRHGGPLGMGPGGPMAAGVDRLLLRRDVEWTYERTANGVTVKITAKDPETVKAIQDRLAAVKERKEIAAAAPAGGCSCPDCRMKEKAEK